jgi:hypothetical protein
MRKVIFVFLLLTLSPMIYSQNLLLNPSFENYWFLPVNPGRDDTFFCKNWYTPKLAVECRKLLLGKD